MTETLILQPYDKLNSLTKIIAVNSDYVNDFLFHNI